MIQHVTSIKNNVLNVSSFGIEKYLLLTYFSNKIEVIL